MQQQPAPERTAPALAHVVERNIRALLSRRAHEERQRTLPDRVADAVTAFTGSMPFVYLHLAVFAFWIIANIGWLPFVPRWDPSFVILATVASVEALLLTALILVSQNRMAALADKRADLHLQVSLLAEHEITRLITLVTAIAEKMTLPWRATPS